MNLDLILVNIVLPDLQPSSQVVDPKQSFTQSPKVLFDVVFTLARMPRGFSLNKLHPQGKLDKRFYYNLTTPGKILAADFTLKFFHLKKWQVFPSY